MKRVVTALLLVLGLTGCTCCEGSDETWRQNCEVVIEEEPAERAPGQSSAESES